jgi:streptomycin 6-kinase
VSYASSTQATAGVSSTALVAEVTAEDGTPAVLKLMVPRDGDAAAHEITVLRLTSGTGCVRLLRDDVARSALAAADRIAGEWR